MPIMRCPHCEDEIDRLDTRADVREYGSYALYLGSEGRKRLGMWEHDDYGESDNEETLCPSCGDELDLEDVLVEDHDAEEEGEPRQGHDPVNPAFVPADGRDPLADFDFCSGCSELKEKANLKSGKCEACREG